MRDANGSMRFEGNQRGRKFTTNLSGADFTGADIRGADFRGATLNHAKFIGVKAGLPPGWDRARQVAAFFLALLALLLSAVSSFNYIQSEVAHGIGNWERISLERGHRVLPPNSSDNSQEISAYSKKPIVSPDGNFKEFWPKKNAPREALLFEAFQGRCGYEDFCKKDEKLCTQFWDVRQVPLIACEVEAWDKDRLCKNPNQEQKFRPVRGCWDSSQDRLVPCTCRPVRSWAWASSMVALAVHVVVIFVILRLGLVRALSWIGAIGLCAVIVIIGTTIWSYMFSTATGTVSESPTSLGAGVFWLATNSWRGAMFHVMKGLAGALLNAASCVLIVSIAIGLGDIPAVGSAGVVVAGWILVVVRARHVEWEVAPDIFLATAMTLSSVMAAIYIAHAANGEGTGQERFALARRLSLLLAGLRGTRFQGADLSGADFTEADLAETDLRGAKLTQVCFHRALGLERALVDRTSPLERRQTQLLLTEGRGAESHHEKASLRDLNLGLVDLKGAFLRGADLRGADLTAADLSGADLSGADLSGACLYGTKMDGVIWAGARIDSATYMRSQLGIKILEDLISKDIRLDDLHHFPPEVHAAIKVLHEELILRIDGLMDDINTTFIELLIIDILKEGTPCKLVEMRQEHGTTVVRIRSSRREDLDKIAEALYQRAKPISRLTEDGLPQRAVEGLLSAEGNRRVDELGRAIDQIQLRAHQQPVYETDLRADTTTFRRPPCLFIGYAPEDKALFTRLEQHLKKLIKKYSISNPHPGNVPPGVGLEGHLKQEMDRADLVLLLISPDFAVSKMCELIQGWAMDRHEQQQAVLMPILVKPIDVDLFEFRNVRWFPSDSVAIDDAPSPDAAWAQVAREVRVLVCRKMEVD